MATDSLPQYYVYRYTDPRPDKNNRPIYIGKGKVADGRPEWRARTHWRHGTKNNPLFQRVLDKIRALGLEPDIKIVAEFEDEMEAFAFEMSLIANFGRRDKGTGPLLNMSDGGEGLAGRIVTPEMKEKHRNAGKNTWANASEEFRATMLSGVAWGVDPEFDARRIAAMPAGRAKRWSKPGVKDADREKLRQVQTARGDDVRAKRAHYLATAPAEKLAADNAAISAGKRKNAAKTSKTSKEVWARPGMNETISASISVGQKKAWDEPRGEQRRETMSAKATEQFANPVSAKKHLDGVNAKWADPVRKEQAVTRMLATRAANKAKKAAEQETLL